MKITAANFESRFIKQGCIIAEVSASLTHTSSLSSSSAFTLSECPLPWFVSGKMELIKELDTKCGN